MPEMEPRCAYSFWIANFFSFLKINKYINDSLSIADVTTTLWGANFFLVFFSSLAGGDTCATTQYQLKKKQKASKGEPRDGK